MISPVNPESRRAVATRCVILSLLALTACLPQHPASDLPPASPQSTAIIRPAMATFPVPGGIVAPPEAIAPEPATPLAAPGKIPASPAQETSATRAADVEAGYTSRASYYAKRFNGRRTFTGERYDPEKLTAASRDLPLQSLARVINPANGREVTVRINDLPRKRKTPLIDLSRAAARELGFLGKGMIRVRVIPLTSPSPATPSTVP